MISQSRSRSDETGVSGSGSDTCWPVSCPEDVSARCGARQDGVSAVAGGSLDGIADVAVIVEPKEYGSVGWFVRYNDISKSLSFR